MASGMAIYKGTAIEDSAAANIPSGRTVTGLRVYVFSAGAKRPAIIPMENLDKGIWAPVIVDKDTLRLVGYEQ